MRVTFMVAFVLIVGAIVAARRSTRADRSARDS
jgi:hypothetical protein